MGMLVNKIKLKWKEMILYILFAGILCVLFFNKVEFHVDELLTYNLANAESWFNPENGVIYSPASQPFLDAMTSNGIFDLKHVWKQQANDTHPPLYYVLVHAVCTLFPNTLSMRYAGIINIIFQLLILYVYRKILLLLFFDNKNIYIMSVMYILSVGILEISTFLRMYVMAMFWVALFTYIILNNLSGLRLKSYVQLVAVTVSGALTHYYFIVFAFFLSLTFVVIMALEKRIKEILAYISTMLISGGVACLIFPYMIRHIFKTGRGAESIDNLGSSDLISQIKIYFEIISKDLFGGYLLIIFFVVAFSLLLNWLYLNYDGERIIIFEKIEKRQYACLLIPSALYVLLISKTAPYNTSRYVSPIYPILIIGIMGIMYKCMACYVHKLKNALVLFSILISVIVATGISNCTWGNLYSSSKERINNAEKYGENASAICLYDTSWKINPYYLEISQCRTITFYNTTDYDEFINNFDIDNYSGDIAFFLIGIDSDLFIERFTNDYPMYEIEKDNGAWGYGKSIYLERKK
jgi:hypothetical protein